MNKTSEIIRFKDLSELDAVAQRLIVLGENTPVWMFEGHMGAGKTTLIKSLCRALGVVSTVQSPTFALVNEYEGADQKVIYHFDFYRIKDEMEALDIGIEEYFDQGDFCFVEWPDKIESLWPAQYMLLELQVDLDTEERVLEVSKLG